MGIPIEAAELGLRVEEDGVVKSHGNACRDSTAASRQATHIGSKLG